jgi:zinc transporter
LWIDLVHLWRSSEVPFLQPSAAGRFTTAPRRQSIVASSGLVVGHLADFQREFDRESAEFAWAHFLLGERLLITGRVKAIQSASRMQAGPSCRRHWWRDCSA